MDFINRFFVSIAPFLLASTCPVEAIVYKQGGDLIIGGIIPVHFFNDSTRQCQGLRDLGALRRVEAMHYAISKINDDSSRLTNITLGYEIYDTCSSPVETLKNALNFIPPLRVNESPVIAVVGAQRSASSIQATNLLGLYNISAISFLSTSDELSDSDRFPYFLRTVAPDKFQVTVITDIINKYQWKYVAFIYTDDSYGKNAEIEFRKQAEEHGICIGYNSKISSTDEAYVYKGVISDLLQLREESLLSVVVVFTLVETATKLFHHASQANVARDFIWLGSDGWGIFALSPVQGVEEAVLGALTIVPKAGIHPEFDRFFERELTNSLNPWKEEYFQAYNCESFSEYPLPPYESLVIDSVEVIARGLDEMKEKMCKGLNKSHCLDVLIQNRRALRDFLLNVTFASDSNGHISFDEHGDANGYYDIKYLMKQTGYYQFNTNGSWLENREQNLVLGPFPWYLEKEANRQTYTDENIPKSVCSDPCGSDQFTIRQTQHDCCWTCSTCKENEIIAENGCVSCFFESNQTYMWPNPKLTHCVPLSDLKLIHKPERVVLLTIALLGIFAVMVVAYLYIKNREKRLIRASSRELGYIVLVGIFLAYLSAMLYSVPVQLVVCYLRRVVPSIATSFIYVALLTMTVRLDRIFGSGKKTAKRPHFISPKSQVFLTLLISLVPLVWAFLWTLIHPPHAAVIIPTQERQVLERICVDSKGLRIGQLVWDVSIVLINCYFAIRTRNLPANYNQSRFIAFSVFSTLVVLVAFAPAFFKTDGSSQQDLYSALGYIIQPTVVMTLIFIVRLYAIFFVNEEDQQIITRPSSRKASEVTQCTLRTVSTSTINGSSQTVPRSHGIDQNFNEVFEPENGEESDFSSSIYMSSNAAFSPDNYSSSNSIEIHSVDENGEDREDA